MMLVACHSVSDKDTIATLRQMQIEIKEEKIEGGLDKAMLGYQRFLEETPDSALKPEAIRRLADLKSTAPSRRGLGPPGGRRHCPPRNPRRVRRSLRSPAHRRSRH
jgi:hypothetical protein